MWSQIRRLESSYRPVQLLNKRDVTAAVPRVFTSAVPAVTEIDSTTAIRLATSNVSSSTNDLFHPDESHHRLPTLVLVILIAGVVSGLVLTAILLLRRRLGTKNTALTGYDEPKLDQEGNSFEKADELSLSTRRSFVISNNRQNESGPKQSTYTFDTGGIDSVHAAHQRDPSRPQSATPSEFLCVKPGDRNTIRADDSISVVWHRTQSTA